MPNRTVEHYLELPYTRRVEPREENGQRYYLAWVEELPSIEMHGDSREEALEHLREVMSDCIQAMIDAGDEIPEPPLWPQGLYGKDAEKNLKRILRAGADSTTVQVAVTVIDEHPEEVEPWAESDAGALTGAAA